VEQRSRSGETKEEREREREREREGGSHRGEAKGPRETRDVI